MQRTKKMQAYGTEALFHKNGGPDRAGGGESFAVN